MNSKFKFLALLILVSVVYGCSPKGDGSISEVIVDGNKMHVFSLNDLKSDTTTISLSSFADYCVLVQLENVKEAYFSSGTTTITEKYIGIRSSRSSYKLFDHSGKFLGNIGSVGRGPGEWIISLYDDIIDEKNELIYLAPFMSDKILVYNTSGKYIKDIIAPHRLQKPKMFLSDNILTVVHMPFKDDKAAAYQFDVKTGEVLKEIAPPPAHFIVQNFNGELFSIKNAPGVFDFLHTSSDTLYHFDMKNNKMLPAFRAIHSAPKNVWMRYFALNKNIFLTSVNMFSEEQEIFQHVGIVATDLNTKASSWIKVVNDFYGNMPVSIMSVNNGYWVINIPQERLMDDIKNRLDQKDLSEDDRQTLNKTLSILKEDENNVVLFGKLKDEIKTKLW